MLTQSRNYASPSYHQSYDSVLLRRAFTPKRPDECLQTEKNYIVANKASPTRQDKEEYRKQIALQITQKEESDKKSKTYRAEGCIGFIPNGSDDHKMRFAKFYAKKDNEEVISTPQESPQSSKNGMLLLPSMNLQTREKFHGLYYDIPKNVIKAQSSVDPTVVKISSPCYGQNWKAIQKRQLEENQQLNSERKLKRIQLSNEQKAEDKKIIDRANLEVYPSLVQHTESNKTQ